MSDQSELPSTAEKQAKKAETLAAFPGLNLFHIRKQVGHLLGLIGGDGIFDQYTSHDLSHIDKMLSLLEWIIPENTKQAMSTADWLMVVLAVYFHDLGMLVTTQEFDSRNESDFPRFKRETLFGGQQGSDYKAKVLALPDERAERFLYQEFVRSRHAERIRLWVTGRASDALGISHQVVKAIDKLLEPLGEQFRRDLGLVCESHHSNELNNRKLFKTAEPYGDSDQETVNIQYCAVLLRTIDLLHVTSDRTPSITFRVINPSDPISQQEWAKQRAVKRVNSKLGLNESGEPDEKAIRDTIQVHAYFTNEDGFFGLTTYLAYAAEQLKQSNEWITAANKEDKTKHEFPWRKIDDSNIQTVGFLRDTFEFAIDQVKILDLLTGHTLYNDTRVVLRELTQNAIDAIRIQNYPDSSESVGKVYIHWDSKSRILSVTDNGTGMTQKFITDFLLRVGTSRYQDPDFKKKYPDFSSISRFGIGVLSAFMIADSVEILTCHPDEKEARQLTLRSVHGKYLIRLIEKSEAAASTVIPHGTSFRLRVRPSVRIGNIVHTAKMWVVIPGCDVFVKVDEGAQEKVGFASPAEAVAAYLAESGTRSEITSSTTSPPEPDSKPPIRIVQKTIEGVVLAYALQWSQYFKEWSFLGATNPRRPETQPSFLGTCIEGIRVDFNVPGFAGGSGVVAIANVTGPNAPKTNVARSGIEATPERDNMLRSVYRIFKNHVAEEIEQLRTSRSYSLTWALEEARYLSQSLISGAVSPSLLEEELKQLPILAVERNGERVAVSPQDFAREKYFWTIECTLLTPAEALIKEATTSASLAGLVRAMKLPNFEFPSDLVLCGARPSATFGHYVYDTREVDQILVNRTQRRIDLRWTDKLTPSRWLTFPADVSEVVTRVLSRRDRSPFASVSAVFIGKHGIDVSGYDGPALATWDYLFLMPDTAAAVHLIPWLERLQEPQTVDMQLATAFNLFVVTECVRRGPQIPDPERFVSSIIADWENELGGAYHLENSIEPQNLVELVGKNNWSVFSPSAWTRKWGET